MISAKSKNVNMTNSNSNGYKYKIIAVKELLSLEQIQIPKYQRPYKWTIKNVNQLIDDILLHKKISAYRMGTLVIHKDKDVYHVVDGQQRCITLSLIAHAIYSSKKEVLRKISTDAHITEYEPKLMGLRFENAISQKNVFLNYQEIKRRVQEFDEEIISLFFYRCQLVQVIIYEISEAFQFFDSQNARGRDLDPHDLLKAFHLREMNNSSTEAERISCVAAWEKMNSDSLALLIGNYLYRIRSWSKGQSGKYFTKNDVDIFKGITAEEKACFPYASLSRIGHFYVDHYNKEYHRNIDNRELTFPFQIDQTIINGKRFFEMIEYYKDVVDKIPSLSVTNNDTVSARILKVLNEYEGRHRKGDAYVRILFNCALIYYIDRFGKVELPRAIEKIFIWAYSLRLLLQAVRIESIDNHALNDHQLFKTIRESLFPSSVLNLPLKSLEKPTVIKGLGRIVELFKEMKYYV
jgi:hypothetical protein